MKESRKSAASNLAHPGGLESQWPSRRQQQALGAEYLHDPTKRRKVRRQWARREKHNCKGCGGPELSFCTFSNRMEKEDGNYGFKKKEFKR